ncbi:MAG: glycosyltransferase [Gaiellales bacterium]|nr:glycosyltransferase [Gaiellales bacterium]
MRNEDIAYAVSKLRVLHVNKRYPPHVGGVEKHLQDLARAQAERPGVQVEVLCVAEGAVAPAPDHSRLSARCRPTRSPTPAGGWERDGRVGVLRLPEVGVVASNPLAWGLCPTLCRRAARDAHDVWHFHYPFPSGELALLGMSRLRPRPPLVCTYHSDPLGESGLKRTLSGAYALLTRGFLQEVDAVIVSSPKLATASRFLPAVEGKVHVIPFGIDPIPLRATPEVAAAAADLRRRWGSPLVLFVGRLVPYKGVEVLLRALPAVRRGAVVIVGEGPLHGSLLETAQRMGVAERVVFVGPLDQGSLAAAYHAADVFVLPSVTPNEAFGLVQLEAHACGLPVISTDLPTGVPFANRHGVSGLVVPPGDAQALAGALNRLLEDDVLRRRLGAQARERFQRDFSLQRMTDHVLELYEDVAAGRGSAGAPPRRWVWSSAPENLPRPGRVS